MWGFDRWQSDGVLDVSDTIVHIDIVNRMKYAGGTNTVCAEGLTTLDDHARRSKSNRTAHTSFADCLPIAEGSITCNCCIPPIMDKVNAIVSTQIMSLVYIILTDYFKKHTETCPYRGSATP